MDSYCSSELWKRELDVRGGDKYEPFRSRLRISYAAFWERATRLAGTISSDLPGLTLHDKTHLAALWDRASQLIYPDFSINPLEVYILGGAILLHDIGHAVAAYPDRINGIKQTIEYKDRLAALISQTNDKSPEEENFEGREAMEKEALFYSLRRLHAKQAKELGTLAFEGEYLIEDNELRENIGSLIGEIASSHHWKRNELDNLPRIQGVFGAFPGEWTIDPLKIACILRCADAIQIDERRVPRFAFALQKPSGVSRLHWLAQRLKRPLVHKSPDGPGSLSFSSVKDFAEENADAWWMAYDLVQVANEELQGCDQLLKDTNHQTLSVNRILGASSPAALKEYIRTLGWLPLNAEVRVTDVERIIQMFGGSQLYGADVTVPLRELIQNAADAVRARRDWRKDQHYQGKIFVILKKQDKDSWKLTVEDNGIGMSKMVLTGTLLEFGKSFWNSEESHLEFPGLTSSNIKQTGRYGIGFFSCLMLTKKISVTSRKFVEAYENTYSLLFREGLQLRPILKKVEGALLLGDLSTRVDLTLRDSDVAPLLRASNHLTRQTVQVSFENLVSHLCPMLDCDVFTQFEDEPVKKVRHQKWFNECSKDWLTGILYLTEFDESLVNSYIEKVLPFLQNVETSDGEVIGRAAIAFGNGFRTGVSCVGRLNSGSFTNEMSQLSDFYVGCLSFQGDGPRRNSNNKLIHYDSVRDWSSGQAKLMNCESLSIADKYIAAMNVARFGGDPSPVAAILVNRKIVMLDEVYQMLKNGVKLLAPVRHDLRHESSIRLSQIQYSPHPGLSFSFNNDIEVLGEVIESLEPWSTDGNEYHAVPSDDNSAASSFLACLTSFALGRGYKLIIGQVSEKTVAVYHGEQSAKENLFPGQEIKMSCLQLSLEI